MHLYLVQHAEAATKEENPDRPLTEKGRNDIFKTARFVSSNMKIQVPAILHSGKTRAKESAEILAISIKAPKGVLEVEGLNPKDDVSIWVNKLSEAKNDIIITGHLPHLSKLASQLVCGNEDQNVVEFKNGCMVSLFRDESNKWSVQWMVIPDILQ
jgi:phosphohistidine phosphatase